MFYLEIFLFFFFCCSGKKFKFETGISRLHTTWLRQLHSFLIWTCVFFLVALWISLPHFHIISSTTLLILSLTLFLSSNIIPHLLPFFPFCMTKLPSPFLFFFSVSMPPFLSLSWSYLIYVSWVLRFMFYLELILRYPDFMFILTFCEHVNHQSLLPIRFIPYLYYVRTYIQITVCSLKYQSPKGYSLCWSKIWYKIHKSCISLYL